MFVDFWFGKSEDEETHHFFQLLRLKMASKRNVIDHKLNFFGILILHKDRNPET